MKCFFLSLAFLLVLIMAKDIGSADGQRNRQCPQVCTYEYKPVCGYNGVCYREFGNECSFNAERCKQRNLQKVSLFMCQQARSGRNSRVRKC